MLGGLAKPIGVGRRLLLEGEPGELLLEAREATAWVEQLLRTAGPGRMRLRVDVEAEHVAFLAPGRARGELAAVGHDNLDGVVFGVDVLLHGLISQGFSQPVQTARAALATRYGRICASYTARPAWKQAEVP